MVALPLKRMPARFHGCRRGLAFFIFGISRNEFRPTGYNHFMSALFPDTHPKMEALQIQLWRQASPTRKMQMLAQLNASARLLAMTGLRSQYPQASEAELRRRLAGLLLGEELARKAFGEISHAK